MNTSILLMLIVALLFAIYKTVPMHIVVRFIVLFLFMLGFLWVLAGNK